MRNKEVLFKITQQEHAKPLAHVAARISGPQGWRCRRFARWLSCKCCCGSCVAWLPVKMHA